jgi:SMC interacting uncharacterized protein involved in chromosome segregation
VAPEICELIATAMREQGYSVEYSHRILDRGGQMKFALVFKWISLG